MGRGRDFQGKENDLKEKIQHGDAFFPLQQYTVSFRSAMPELSVHWHPEMEITRIMEGRAVYSVDLQEYEVEEGDMICISPNLLHSARVRPGENMTSETFVFHLDMLTGSAADICALRYFSPLMEGKLQMPHVILRSDSIYGEAEPVFEDLLHTYRDRKKGYELRIKADLFYMLQLLVPHSKAYAAAANDSVSERMKLIFGFIHEHYAEDISVEDIAQICCVSPSHFMHYFKEKSGVTFNRYLNQYRLGQAAMMLRKGAGIAEAAYANGFNNLPYFYRRFREYYHMTPNAFRETELPDKDREWLRFYSN